MTHTTAKSITSSELFPGCMSGPSHTCSAAWSLQLAQHMLREQEFFTSAFQLILHHICHYIHQRNETLGVFYYSPFSAMQLKKKKIESRFLYVSSTIYQGQTAPGITVCPLDLFFRSWLCLNFLPCSESPAHSVSLDELPVKTPFHTHPCTPHWLHGEAAGDRQVHFTTQGPSGKSPVCKTKAMPETFTAVHVPSCVWRSRAFRNECAVLPSSSFTCHSYIRNQAQ